MLSHSVIEGQVLSSAYSSHTGLPFPLCTHTPALCCVAAVRSSVEGNTGFLIACVNLLASCSKGNLKYPPIPLYRSPHHGDVNSPSSTYWVRRKDMEEEGGGLERGKGLGGMGGEQERMMGMNMTKIIYIQG